MDVRTLDKEKGERLRTEEEKRQLKEEYETYDAKLFLDPRKVPCWRTAVLGAFGTAASLSALQLLYRIKYASTCGVTLLHCLAALTYSIFRESYRTNQHFHNLLLRLAGRLSHLLVRLPLPNRCSMCTATTTGSSAEVLESKSDKMHLLGCGLWTFNAATHGKSHRATREAQTLSLTRGVVR